MMRESTGKIRAKRTRGPKPYERTKSLLERVTSTVKSLLVPSWLSGEGYSGSTFDDNNEEDDIVELEDNHYPHGYQIAQDDQVTSPSFGTSLMDGPSRPRIYSSPADTQIASLREGRGFLKSSANDNGSTLKLRDHERTSSVPTSYNCGPVLNQRARGARHSLRLDRHLDTETPKIGNPNQVTGDGFRSLPFSEYSSSKGEPLVRSYAHSDKYQVAGQAPASSLETEPAPINVDDTDRVTESDLAEEEGETDSDASTSGCSSLKPDREKMEAALSESLPLTRDSLRKLTGNLSSVANTSGRRVSDNMETAHASSRQSSLWSVMPQLSESRPQSVASSSTSFRRQSFNSSIFGSAVGRDPVSMYGTGVLESPFYPGKTSYGGASTFRRGKLVSDPYQSASRSAIKVNARNSTGTGYGVTSSTARKILDTLERMSTPLNDTKKIPLPSNDLDATALTPLSYTPSSTLRRLRLHGHTPSKRSIDVRRGPPAAKLNSPRPASIATNRRSLLLKNTSAEREAEAAKAAVRDDGLACESRAAGGKMKRPRTSHHATVQRDEETTEADVETPDFSQNIGLELNSMPQFNFSTPILPVESSATPVSHSRKVRSDNPAEQNAVTSAGLRPQKFTFSSPIQQAPVSKNLRGEGNQGMFKFSSPVSVTTEDAKKETPEHTFQFGTGSRRSSDKSGFQFVSPSSSAPSTKSDTSPVAGVLKSGSVLEALGKRGMSPAQQDVDNESGALKPAAELMRGSVMDILGNGGRTVPLSAKAFKTTNSWSCPTCLINNKEKDSECAACKTAKPVASAVPDTNTTTEGARNAGWSSQFKPAADSWPCPTCLINNKNSDARCVACQTQKPGGGTASTSSSGFSPVSYKRDDIREASGSDRKSGREDAVAGFGDRFKQPTGNWSCSVCMVSNSVTADKCLACETPKSGASGVKSGFGDKFKVVSGNWECDTCMVRNKGEASKCIACTTPRPGSQAIVAPSSSLGSSVSIGAGGFTFGGASKSAEPAAASTFKLTTSSPSSREFGSGGFALGGDSDKVDEKSVSKPTFTFGAPTTTTTASASTAAAPAVGGFKFGAEKDNKAPAVPTKPGGFSFGNNPVVVDAPGGASAVPAATPAAVKFDFAATETQKATLFSVAPTQKSDVVATSADSSKSASAATYSFGAIAAKPAAAVTTSGAGEKAAFAGASTAKPGGFSFGNAAEPASAIPLVSGVFGQASASKPTVNFAFGNSGTNTTSSADNKPSFTFGKPAEAGGKTDKSAFGFEKSASTQGSSAAAAAAPQVSKSGGFMFGQSADSSKQSFAFGQPAAAVAPTQPVFSFGQSATVKPNTGFVPSPSSKRQNDDTEGAAGGKKTFQFNAVPTAASNPLSFGQSTTTSVATTLAFGQAATTSAVTPLAFGQGTSTSSAAPLAFGQSATTSAAAPLAFGQPTSTTAPSSASFAFNGSTAAFNTPAAPAAAPAPAFGSSAVTSPPSFGSAAGGGFNFNAVPNLQFGATAQPAAAPFAFNQAAAAAPAPAPSAGFDFSQSSAPGAGAGAAAGGGGFNFGGPNPTFNFSAGPTQQSGVAARKIKRAVRRTARK
ncbi:PREDICTED: nuclear pore complex protein Nup153-like isoform X2 [Priapulus caudatus]|uniref:Nuclear pore complex protein Nup153 n=1 Tax=Priapulus caudatus TaxID=37621 RepID=A0ABM1DRI9_PRICU|nr:PREDICTED: nuclear pore complex protein Nup153-like isoform X2 [Priapulus caudatus]